MCKLAGDDYTAHIEESLFKISDKQICSHYKCDIEAIRAILGLKQSKLLIYTIELDQIPGCFEPPIDSNFNHQRIVSKYDYTKKIE